MVRYAQFRGWGGSSYGNYEQIKKRAALRGYSCKSNVFFNIYKLYVEKHCKSNVFSQCAGHASNDKYAKTWIYKELEPLKALFYFAVIAKWRNFADYL